MGTHSIMPSSSNNEQEEMAAKMIDRFIQKDSTYQDLIEILHLSGHTEPHVSGLQDYDYPDVASTHMGSGVLKPTNVATRVPLPAELVEQFAHMQSNCMMGLFPEIGRAWLTIDSDLFIWTYSNATDLAYFNGLNETILSVGLAKPKPGIFRNHIHYLLCLATPVEVILLGVSFSTDDFIHSEMHLLPEPLFTLPSDNTFFVCTATTFNGRIFMGSKDGCLYEFCYQASDGWFTRKCRKINHSSNSLAFLVPSFLTMAFSEDAIVQIAVDNTRHILFTRSEKGTIQVYDMGKCGNEMYKVITMSHQTITNYATKLASTIDPSNFKTMVHIAAVEDTESAHINLVVITQSGVRLYFTTSMNNASVPSRPSCLHLMHIRLPPGFAANAIPQRPSKVHIAHYRKGTLLLVSSQNNDDALWMLSSDNFPFQPHLMETQCIIPLDSKVWAMAEVINSELRSLPQRHTNNPVDPPLVVTQHIQQPRQFHLLTPLGIYIVTQTRPVDRLRQLLVENQGPECEAVKSFFILHQEEQACASCLILACSSSSQDIQVAEWATRAFFIFGGEPHVSQMIAQHPHESPFAQLPFGSPIGTPPAMSNPNIGQQQTSTPISLPFSQTSLMQTPHMQTPHSPEAMQMVYSGKHNGLYLYASRIIRYIWDSYFVRELTVKTQQGKVKYLENIMSSGDFDTYLTQISVLREFLERNGQIKLTSMSERTQNLSRVRNLQPSDMSHLQQHKKSQVEAQLQERASLVQLQQLLSRISEMLGLCKVLVEHQFSVIASTLDRDSQTQLRSMTFRDLIINGKAVANALVTALVNRYLGDCAATDTISTRLQEVCPSLYKPEDAVSAKTIEILLQARQVHNVQEKEQLVNEALKLAKQIPLQTNLGLICSHFQAIHCYNAIVELCLMAAIQCDPQDVALQFYRNGQPSEDQQGLYYYVKRMETYKIILDTLNDLIETSSFHPKAPTIPKLPGPPPEPQSTESVRPNEAMEYFEKMFQYVLKSNDELCHVSLYDWLLDRNLTDKLLEVRTSYLESFLKRSMNTHPETSPMLNLLWKYYEKSGNYSAAARILAKLAEREGPDLTLAQRIEYLSRAAMCLKSSPARSTSGNEGEFLQELEEKLEIARIQLQITDALEKAPQQPQIIPITKLHSELMPITKLYEDYAEPNQLSECQLAILHCANYLDPALVERLWSNIIDREFNSITSSQPETIMTVVGSKLKKLGRLYVSSLNFFPIVFLIRTLEQKSSVLGLEYDWVFTIMEHIGISFSRLFEIYDKLYKAKDPIWPSLRKPLHLLQVLHKLMESFISHPFGSQQERRQIASDCLDCISRYLVDLQALSPSINQSVDRLMTDFKSVQAKFERLA